LTLRVEGLGLGFRVEGLRIEVYSDKETAHLTYSGRETFREKTAGEYHQAANEFTRFVTEGTDNRIMKVKAAMGNNILNTPMSLLTADYSGTNCESILQNGADRIDRIMQSNMPSDTAGYSI